MGPTSRSARAAAGREDIAITLDTNKPGDQAPDAGSAAEAARQPHARWPYRWLATGAGGIAASFCWPPLYASPTLVLLGQDQRVWAWLVAVGSGLAVGAGLLGILHNLERNHDAWWKGVLLTLCSTGVVLLIVVAAILALLIGALSFGNSYRDLGNAHGDGIVVALYPSNGYSDSELLFGTRHGIWVDFDPRSRRIVANDATLSDWNFALQTTATSTQVHYSHRSGPAAARTVTLPRTAAGTADDEAP